MTLPNDIEIETVYPNTTKRILILPGYRAHCEFEFNAEGNLLAAGSFDSL